MVQSKTRLGYMYGLNLERKPHEYALPTNAEKFQEVVGDMGAYYAVAPQPDTSSPGKGKNKERMAGDALNLDLKQSLGTPKYVPLPPIGSAELRIPGLPQ